MSRSPDGAAFPLRYDQIDNGCWTACIAGLTGLSKKQLDHLVPPLFRPGEHDVWEHRKDAREYNDVIVPQFLLERGWLIVPTKHAPKGFAIGSGMSPRGIQHAVIVLDGKLWHDPHPSRAGVIAFDDFEVLIPLVERAA